MHRPRARARRPHFVLGAIGISVALLAGSGCDQLSARTLVQEGNALYEDQEYEKAVEKYEAALKKTPDLEVIHHNLGVAYSRLFRPGVTTPENKAIADKAATHLQAWLAKHPDDSKVQKYLLNLWIDASDYQPVLDHFMAEHQKHPDSRETIGRIAGIHLMRQDWRSAIEWYYKEVALAPDDPAKVAVYANIANVAFGQLWTSKGRLEKRATDRTELAEIGLEAAEKGLALDPKHLPLNSYSQQLWNQRGIAHGPYWAAAIDRAEAQVFEQRVRVLREEAKKNQPPPAAPGTAAGTGTGS